MKEHKAMKMDSSSNQMFGSFYLGNCEFAIPADRIEQVVDLPKERIEVPQSPPHVKGTFNLRGTVITVVDLEVLFGIQRKQKSELNQVAVLELNGQCIGVLFESTGEVFRGASEELSEFEPDTCRGFVSGVFKRFDGKRLVQVLDVEGLFQNTGVPRDTSRRKAAIESDSNSDRGSRTQYMTFFLDDTNCALPIESVQEVFEVQSIEQTLLTGQSCLGLTELRGGTLPIMDLSALLGCRAPLNGDDALRGHNIIVMRRDKDLFGLLVDRISGIISACKNDVVAFPSANLLQTDMHRGCIVREASPDVVIFDCDSILRHEEIEEITRVHGKVAESPLRALSSQQDKAKTGQRETYLTFTADATYAVLINEIQEIIDLPAELMQLPGLPSCFSGVVNLRGQTIVAIVDLRNGVNRYSDEEEASQGQVMIFDSPDGKAGLIVDSVDSIVSVADSEKMQFPKIDSFSPDGSQEYEESINFETVDGKSLSVTVVKMQSLLQSRTFCV